MARPPKISGNRNPPEDEIIEAEWNEIDVTPKIMENDRSESSSIGLVETFFRGLKNLIIAVGALVVISFIFVAMNDAEMAIDESSVPESGFADGEASALEHVCERTDIQDLVAKEASSIILDGARNQIIGLAFLGLIDPSDYSRAFENADFTFSNVRSYEEGDGTIACIASIRIDASNATVGQDIVQSPDAFWIISFADGNMLGNNFTIEVDPSSLVLGMLINGHPVIDSFDEGEEQTEQIDQIPDVQRGVIETELPPPSVEIDESGTLPTGRAQIAEDPHVLQ